MIATYTNDKTEVEKKVELNGFYDKERNKVGMTWGRKCIEVDYYDFMLMASDILQEYIKGNADD